MPMTSSYPAVTGPDLGRLAQVHCPGRSRGTGFLVAEGLVLTAAHVVAGPGAGAGVQVRLFNPAAAPDVGWVAAQVVPAGAAAAALDVALLRVASGSLPSPVTPAPGWGRIVGAVPVAVFAVCFPKAMKDGGSPDSHVVRGIVEPAQGGRRFAAGQAMLAVAPESIVPRRDDDEASPWAGSSGAAVFAERTGQLIGVLTDDFDIAVDASVLTFTLVANAAGLAEIAGARIVPGSSPFLDPPLPSRFQPFIRPGNTALRNFNAADWSTLEGDALAVQALSGGRSLYVTEAARDIFTDEHGYHDEPRADRAVRAAREQGINKYNARSALLALARQSSPPVSPGRIDIVQRGINRFARARQSVASANAERSSLLHDFQRASGEGHRLDLAGDWATERTQRLATGLMVRAEDYHLTPVLALGYVVVLEALRTYSLNDLLRAHPFALIQVSQAIQIFLSHGRQDERLTAATIELFRVRSCHAV